VGYATLPIPLKLWPTHTCLRSHTHTHSHTYTHTHFATLSDTGRANTCRKGQASQRSVRAMHRINMLQVSAYDGSAPIIMQAMLIFSPVIYAISLSLSLSLLVDSDNDRGDTCTHVYECVRLCGVLCV
jgi:hypothetical protein